MKEIIIKYKPDGSVELEAKGFKGTTCLQGTLAYEKALGLTGENSIKVMKEGGDSALRLRNKIQQ